MKQHTELLNNKSWESALPSQIEKASRMLPLLKMQRTKTQESFLPNIEACFNFQTKPKHLLVNRQAKKKLSLNILS